MYNDGINEIGRYLKETGERSDFALNRHGKAVPTVETIREYFDADYPVTVYFESKPTEHVKLTLNFLTGTDIALANQGCGDCFCTNIQRFTNAGDQQVTLAKTPISEASVSVYINNIKTNNFTLSGKQITIGTSVSSTDIVEVSYVYQYGNCSGGSGGTNCPDCDCDTFSRGTSCELAITNEIGVWQIQDESFTGLEPEGLGTSWGTNWSVMAYYDSDFIAGQPYNTEAGVEIPGTGYLKVYAGSVINSAATARTTGAGSRSWETGPFTVEAALKPTYTGSGGLLAFTFGIQNFSTGYFDRWVIGADDIWDFITSGESPGTVLTTYPFGKLLSGTWYKFKWEYQPPPSQPDDYPSTGYSRIKIWPENESEPVDWLINTENAGGAQVAPSPNNQIYLTLSSVGLPSSDTKMEFKFCGGAGSDDVDYSAGWGTGNLGTWYNQYEMLELYPQEPGQFGDVPDRYYISDGKAALQYGPNSPTLGPQQGLKFLAGMEYPIKIYYEFYATNNEPGDVSVGFDQALYFGQYHYADEDAWLTFFPSRDNGKLFLGISALSRDSTQWPFDSVFSEITGYPFDSTIPWAMRILIDETGPSAKMWPVSEPEPDWQVSGTWDAATYGGINPPPRTNFRYVYWESQAFNSGLGDGTDCILWFDNICIGGEEDEPVPPPSIPPGSGGGSDPDPDDGGNDPGSGGHQGGGGNAPAGDLPAVTHVFHGTGNGTPNEYSALQSFFNGLPCGAVVGFDPPDGVFKIGGSTLHIANPCNLTVVGGGSTIWQSTRTGSPNILIDGGGGFLRLDSWNSEGSNPNPGKWDFDYEHNHGFQIGGIVGVDANSCNVINVGGDGWYLSGGGGQWAQNIRIHNSVIDGIGRMGVAVTDGAEYVVVDYNTFRNIGYYVWDIEPNGAIVDGRDAGGLHIRFSDNIIQGKPYGDYPSDPTQALGYIFVITGTSGGGPAEDVEISRNIMTVEGAIRMGLFNNGGTRKNIRILNNKGKDAFVASGAINEVISAQSVNGLQIKNNTQKMTSGTFENHSGSTDVDISGNILT